jgi:hypothetical protein
MKMADKSHPSGCPVADGDDNRTADDPKRKQRIRFVAATIQYVPTPGAKQRLFRAYQILLDLFPDVDNAD